MDTHNHLTIVFPSAEPIYAALNSRAVSDAARELVQILRRGIEHHEGATKSRAYKRKGRKLEEFDSALGAFVADLLRAMGSKDADGWVFRSTKAESFSGEPVSYATFRRIVSAMTGFQFVEQVKGSPRWKKNPFHEDLPYNAGGTASLFRATRPLLNLAKTRGITPENVDTHFLQELPKHPLVLKTTSRKDEIGRKTPSRRMAYATTPETEKLEADLKRLNSFLDQFKLTGGLHRGYYRVFNLGDDPEFAWNKGGRLYSQGQPSYQQFKESNRVLMRIDGEPVVEIDIKASHLTILHGLLDLPFSPAASDPYEVGELQPLKTPDTDLRRWVVKSWTVATLGHDKHHTRWPQKTIEDFHKKTRKHLGTGQNLGSVYPIRQVRAAMEAKHPILRQWGSLGISWADLQFIESEAVIGAMVEMMDNHNAPSLSVHDSLVVRLRDLEIAKDLLTRHYHERCGLRPELEIDYGDTGHQIT
jgi:hypothetical protein